MATPTQIKFCAQSKLIDASSLVNFLVENLQLPTLALGVAACWSERLAVRDTLSERTKPVK